LNKNIAIKNQEVLQLLL